MRATHLLIAAADVPVRGALGRLPVIVLTGNNSARVFVELRGTNYQGSTCTLVYDPAADQLKGIYFQTALNQQFEVFFQRLKMTTASTGGQPSRLSGQTGVSPVSIATNRK